MSDDEWNRKAGRTFLIVVSIVFVLTLFFTVAAGVHYLRECEAPPEFCPICDTTKATRNATLEEAARMAESFWNFQIAAAIRALKDKP